MSLDLVVAQAVRRVRILECAVHDRGPWYLKWGPHYVEAQRTLTATSVVFSATFPESCYLVRPQTLELYCRDELVSVRALTDPGDIEFDVAWELAVEETVLAG